MYIPLMHRRLTYVCPFSFRRRALHNYDPSDFQASLASAALPMDTETPRVGQDNVVLSIQDQELADAKKKGLPVDIGDFAGRDDNFSPTSVLEIDDRKPKELNELDQWDAARGEDEFEWENDQDSDDDLL